MAQELMSRWLVPTKISDSTKDSAKGSANVSGSGSVIMDSTKPSKAAWQALLPLFQGVAANLEKAENPGSALTGPIARGDINTVQSHLGVLPKKHDSGLHTIGHGHNAVGPNESDNYAAYGGRTIRSI